MPSARRPCLVHGQTVGGASRMVGTPVEVPDLSNRCHLNGCLAFGSNGGGGRCLEFVLQSARQVVGDGCVFGRLEECGW